MIKYQVVGIFKKKMNSLQPVIVNSIRFFANEIIVIYHMTNLKGMNTVSREITLF